MSRYPTLLALLTATAALTLSGSKAPQPAMPVLVNPAVEAAEAPEEVEATESAEVRLRKLHLVRPDLIPYPLAVETFC